MKMQKTTLAAAVGMVLGGASMSTQAALTSSAVLVLDSGVGFCKSGGTYPACLYGASKVTTGSWFSMDTNGDGHTGNERVPQTSIGGVASTKGNGLAIHETFDNSSNAMGSHPGTITGGENPQFNIWEFFGNTGMDYLSSPMADLGTDSNGDHIIDMSGWVVSWAGIPSIPMGGDTLNFAADTQVATMACSTPSCSFSSTFSLDYDAHVPLGDASGFGGVAYRLHLEGSVGQNLAHVSVPVPAAAWLFGSGLVGLVGVARRKKGAK